MKGRFQAVNPVRWRKLFGNVLTVAITLIAASAAAAQNSLLLTDFSATEIAHVRGREVASKIYHSGVNFRAEPAPGVAMIYVTASDEIYSLMFNGTQCIETRGINAHSVSSPLQLLSGTKLERKYRGTEVINGRNCKIEDVTVTAADGKRNRFTLWEATELRGTPIKLDFHSERGSVTTTYRDIALGTPDPELFVPPNNCKPFEKSYQIAPPGK